MRKVATKLVYFVNPSYLKESGDPILNKKFIPYERSKKAFFTEPCFEICKLQDKMVFEKISSLNSHHIWTVRCCFNEGVLERYLIRVWVCQTEKVNNH